MSDASPPIPFPVAPRATAYDSPVFVDYRGTRTAFACPAELARHVRDADKLAAKATADEVALKRGLDWHSGPKLARLQFALVDAIFGAFGAKVGMALMVLAVPLLILALTPARAIGG